MHEYVTILTQNKAIGVATARDGGCPFLGKNYVMHEY